MEFSSRALTNHFIYRQKIIEHLKSLDRDKLETCIPNLLVKKHLESTSGEINGEAYTNNLWLLDEKFITYDYFLREENMDKVLEIVCRCRDSNGSECKDDNLPDISILFSNDPHDPTKSFDIALIQLIRTGMKDDSYYNGELQVDTIIQALTKYFCNRVQRVWFYRIVDIDDLYLLHLKNQQYKPLSSNGNIFFRSKNIYPDLQGSLWIIQNSYVMDYKALIEDADSRNKAFLGLFRNKVSFSDE